MQFSLIITKIKSYSPTIYSVVSNSPVKTLLPKKKKKKNTWTSTGKQKWLILEQEGSLIISVNEKQLTNLGSKEAQ